MTRVLLLDAKYGWMVEQQYYDANGQLLLSARASQHRYYPDDAVTMPHHVEVRLLPGQPSQLAFEMDVSRYCVQSAYGRPERIVGAAPISRASRGGYCRPAVPPARGCVPPDPYGAGHRPMALHPTTALSRRSRGAASCDAL